MATGAASPTRPKSELRYRRNAVHLTRGQAKLLRDSFSAVYGISDDRGYDPWAGVHGLPMPIGSDNAHGSPYFLPLHRAYTKRANTVVPVATEVDGSTCRTHCPRPKSDWRTTRANRADDLPYRWYAH